MVNLFSRVPHIYHTYTGLTMYTCGFTVSIIASTSIIFENMARTIVFLIALWSMISYLIEYDFASSAVDEDALTIHVALISSLLLLVPTVAMLFFGDLVISSLIGFISTAFISIIVLVNFLIHEIDLSATGYHEWLQIFPADLYGLALCIGIFISNVAGHAFSIFTLVFFFDIVYYFD